MKQMNYEIVLKPFKSAVKSRLKYNTNKNSANLNIS